MYRFIKIKKSNACLICFKPLFINNDYLFSSNRFICSNCHLKFEKINKTKIISDVKYHFLYRYNDFAKEIVYKYKGCFDYVLKDVFYDLIPISLRLKFLGKTIMYPPSSLEDDIKRGFNHMDAIAKSISTRHENIFKKNKTYKQSDHSFQDRKNISDVLIKTKNPHSKRIIIIDDIYTSGSTINSLIKLLGPDYKIEVIIFFKTEGESNE